MRNVILVAATIVAALCSQAYAEDSVVGTYKLISEGRKIVDTGEFIPVSNPVGFITYGPEGRMMVLIVRDPRPHPESVDKLTDQDRVGLFKTMTAYGGTYKVNEDSITHELDVSWNQAWTGTKQLRYFKREGERLVYTTPPYPFSSDGRMSVNTLVWEKVK